MENKVEKNETMTDTEELEKAADALLVQADENPHPKRGPAKRQRPRSPLPPRPQTSPLRKSSMSC